MQELIPYIILLLYSAICAAEAWLEKVVIDLKDPRLSNYHDLNQKEHFRSLVLAVLMAMPFILMAVYFQYYWLLLAILVGRRLFFDHPLKKLRDKKIRDIEGKGPFDSLFRWIYGSKGGWWELATEVIITITSIILTIYHG